MTTKKDIPQPPKPPNKKTQQPPLPEEKDAPEDEDTPQAYKKPSAYEIRDALFNAVEENLLSAVTFRDRPFPDRYLLQVTDENTKKILKEEDHSVVRYVSDTAISDAVLAFTHNLPKSEYYHYRIGPSQSENVSKYWRAASKKIINVDRDVAPVLQKSTPGYTFKRLDFDMKEGPTPTYDSMMDMIEVNAEAMEAYLGALFDRHRTPQQYLWLTGSGGDGKGSIMRFLQKIFGSAHKSVATDHNMIDKYWQSSLMGKRVAVCGDTKNLDFINSSIFMQVTGGDSVTIREMRKEEYSVKLNAMFIFGANANPNISSEFSAQRRAIICEMDRTKFKYIEGFEEKLWDERAAIVHKWWEAWKKVRDKSRIPVSEDALERLAEDTEEYWDVLVDQYFEIGEGLTCTAKEVKVSLSNEKRQLNNKQIGAWKRYIKRRYGVYSKAQKKKGSVNKMYFGMSVKTNKGQEVDY